MKIINILGIRITDISKNDLQNWIEQCFAGQRQHYIVTPNPEIILAARNDEEFFYILNHADAAIPDGMGLKFAALAMGRNIQRITGADLTVEILEYAQDKRLKVAIANWRGSLSNSEDMMQNIKILYPDLNLRVATVDRADFRKIHDHEALIKIAAFNPDILFTNLGAPYQEKFIYHSLHKLPSVKLAMGIGGSFDFLIGKMKRAPEWMRNSGLEWLYRLIQEPWRLKRIYNAVFVFSYEFLMWRLVLPFFYRPNIACLLYKKVNGKYHILLVERTDSPGHWQLPQGGIDNQDLIEAGSRELREEINCHKFKPIAAHKDLHKYHFTTEGIKSDRSAKHIMRGYKGQRQSLFIAEFLGQDSDIHINFWDHSGWKWVDAGKVLNEVYPSRKKATEIYLDRLKKIISNS